MQRQIFLNLSDTSNDILTEVREALSGDRQLTKISNKLKNYSSENGPLLPPVEAPPVSGLCIGCAAGNGIFSLSPSSSTLLQRVAGQEHQVSQPPSPPSASADG